MRVIVDEGRVLVRGFNNQTNQQAFGDFLVEQVLEAGLDPTRDMMIIESEALRGPTRQQERMRGVLVVLALATVCIAVAAVWAGQRVLSVIGTL